MLLHGVVTFCETSVSVATKELNMIVLTFKNFENESCIFINPSLDDQDYCVSIYPTAKLKVYDLQTGEIITFMVDNFQWIEVNSIFSERLKTDFKDSNRLDV
jgi:hypothetical protein